MEGGDLYLLTRFNEFLNGHHAILIPVHLLQKGNWEGEQDGWQERGR